MELTKSTQVQVLQDAVLHTVLCETEDAKQKSLCLWCQLLRISSAAGSHALLGPDLAAGRSHTIQGASAPITMPYTSIPDLLGQMILILLVIILGVPLSK